MRAAAGLGSVALACALLLCGGCASSVDRQRAAICRRTVPAVAPGGATATVLQVARGPSPDSVRVDYVLGQRDGRQRWVLCGFGAGAVLAGLSTERGPMSGAALYLLRRYYLDTPDAVAADPPTVSP